VSGFQYKHIRFSMGGNQCPICLEPITAEAFLDQCFHKFCYHCILQWSQTLSNQQPKSFPRLHCPLCKMQNTSIIHNFIGPTFQRHYISKLPAESFALSEAHVRRLKVYSEPPGGDAHLSMSNRDCFASQLYINDNRNKHFISRTYVAVSNKQALGHRKQHGNLPSSRWLQCWIRRELQALMQEEDVDIVMHHVLGVLESFQRRTMQKISTGESELRRAQYKSSVSDAVRPFIFENSGRFADELEAFLISGLDIAAYDEFTFQGSKTGYISGGSSSRELSNRDASVLYASSEVALDVNTDGCQKSTQTQCLDLLDEDVEFGFGC